MKIGEAVRKVCPNCKPEYLAGFDGCDDVFKQYSIDTPLRIAHFLGQFGGETDGGRVLYESGDYKSVARLMQIFGVGHHSARITEDEAARIVAMPMPDKEKHLFERVYGAGNPGKMRELGNRPGDGWTFRGTGVLQSTGRGAAKQWGDRVGVSFESQPALMIAPKYVLMPALLEWDAGKLNRYADINDSRHIRRVINGGYNGYDECVAWFRKFYAVLKDDKSDPAQDANPDDATKLLQSALNQLGASPPLAVDGRYGPATTAAVKWFQNLNDLTVDGIAGIMTRSMIQLRLDATRGGVPLAGGEQGA